jgi:hypothetical protein
MTTRKTATWLKVAAALLLAVIVPAWAIAIGLDARRYGWEEEFGSWDIDLFMVSALVIPCLLAWLGFRLPGLAGGCLLLPALLGFFSAALGAGSDAVFRFVAAVWAMIPFAAGILFLIASGLDSRRRRPPPRLASDDRGHLW